MFALELGGKDYAWNWYPIISLFAGFALLLIGFIYRESKAADPIVPLVLFRKRLFTASQLISFFYGAVMISAATYIPIYVQGVYQGTASQSGTVLTPMMLGVVARTEAGKALFHGLLSEQLLERMPKCNPIYAALPFVHHGNQEEIAGILRERIEQQEQFILHMKSVYEEHIATVPRGVLHLMMGAYEHAKIELSWLERLHKDAEHGRLLERGTSLEE
ncbi:hypothetical protein [Paenibacillus gansuensis]|uniref:Uncharacterized protein n=1 Tax=Paenibacillus gansuensis TaxID=306542 RepID=A0ABW5P9Q0_9BACL